MNQTIHIGNDALAHLLAYCERESLHRFTLVADENTFAALGKRVHELFSSRGMETRVIVLRGEAVSADERAIMQVLIQDDHAARVYLAIGSGTITDIVRFASFVTKNPFISVPTAPSVDGYTSSGAALAIGNTKQTFRAQPPIAIFADLDTLVAAPRPMIAAGFADMLGKFTALADWKLGHLVWGERYSDAIAQRTQTALNSCVSRRDQIAQVSAAGVQGLMEALVESGLCIAAFGSSEPASGSEHHLSHYWEMKLLRENRPALLHGAKVGVASILIARLYKKISQLTRDQVITRLSAVQMPDRAGMIRSIQEGFDTSADTIIASHAPFLEMSADDFDALKQNIAEHWAEIQAIAATVPPPPVLAERLAPLNAPTTPRDLGLTDQDVLLALKYAHYLRNRFTALKLGQWLNLVGDNDFQK